MSQIRISDAAALLGVSDDTVRRMIDAQRLPSTHDGSG
ncbi:MAG: excisionase family DNA-binding protein, partial [Dermatophilaceae bacterium]|nr:excisionase family DNA-binding protein [Dermatophilaceae bacterium]